MNFEDIKGLGVKRIEKLKEAGLMRPADLLTVFPSKYVFGGSFINDFGVGEEAALFACCASLPACKYIRKGLSFVRATFFDGRSNFDCVWFNQPYVKNQLFEGKRYALIGRVKKTGSKPEIYVSSCTAAEEDEKIMPIYPSCGKIPAKILRQAIRQVLQSVNVEGQISDYFCEQNGILPFNKCIKAIHCPSDKARLIEAKTSAALQIMSYNIAVFFALKGENRRNNEKKYADNRRTLRKVIDSLPYKLTADQEAAVEQILTDLHSGKRMNRLIEGDVGCGKTVVAFLAMYYAAMSGYQAALMAPTEILAEQHYEKALKFFGDIKCEFVSGSQSKERRAEALFNIASGNAQIIIGTHSLFQDAVQFKNLALTIADEQHRFGVEQRGSLENKGQSTDSLVMSATPIPRTLALTLYGDLDISVIAAMPEKKAKIFTKFVPEKKQNDMFDYIYRKTAEGEKSYVVCPRVEDEESVSATAIYAALHKKYGNTVGLIHGQMKDENKNKIMRAFKDGKIMILVSTTVIEVGIDVPDAINIIILSAESYGLSQLHQLRGRVGRGTKDSYCFVLCKTDKPDDRLKYFINNDSGFDLAEYDFRVRGAGDFLGKRQHGTDSIFCDVGIDEELLKRAKKLADRLIECNEIDTSSGDYIKGLTLN